MAKETEQVLKLSKIFGYQQAVKGSLGFSKTYGLTSITGKKGIHYKSGNNQQTFTSIPEENKITAVGFGADDLLIIASKGKKATVAVFNFRNNVKKILPVAEKIISDSFVWVCFSENNERIGAQGGPPDWGLALWLWEKRRLEIMFHPFRMEPGAKVYKLTFNPSDSRYIVAVGKHFLRCYFFKDQQRIQETALHEQERSEQTFHSAAWIPNSRLVMVGTSGGNILVLENMHLVRQVSITEELTRFQSSVNIDDQNVSCIVLTSDGILCSHGTSSVLWFEDNFKLHKVLSIPESSKESRVIQLSMNVLEDTITASTEDGRILVYCSKDRSNGMSFEDNFRVIQGYQHTQTMICADAIQMTPLQASCSEINVILMDYITGEVVLRNQLSSKPRSISLCSLGTSLAIGHEDAVRIYNVVNDTLVETKSFKEASDSRVAFAPGGHLIAFTENGDIHLHFSVGFKRLASFKKHNGKVQNLLWRQDNSLLSAGDEGTIYEWDIPRKKVTWKLSLPKVKHVALASLSKDISNYLYVASSDNKIRCIKDGIVMVDYILNNVKVTTLLVTDDLLLAGSDTGKIVGFLLTLEATTFEVRFHVGSICHVASFCDGASVIAIDSYGIVSTWNFQNKTYGGTLPSRKEVLIDVDKKKKLMQNINEMEEKLRQCTQKADEGKALQNTRFQGEEMKVWGEYREIQCSLRSTIHKLEDEIRVLKSEFEKKHLNNMSTIKNEEEKNEKYFKKKLAEEEVCLQQAKEERERLLQEFERSLAQLKSEEDDVIKEFNTKYCRHQNKFQELEDVLDRERTMREMTKNAREDFIRQATDTRLRSGFDAVCDLRNEMVKEKYMPELDGINAEFNYEKERNRSIEEDFRKKHDTFRRLDDIAKELKIRLDQKLGDIFRMEVVLDTKTDFSNKLQLEALELTVEGDHKIKECQLELEDKEKELAEVKQKLQKIKDSHKELSATLKIRKREEIVLNERLKSTEKSVIENTTKVMAAEIYLERYRLEFVSSTSECPSNSALRWAMLRLYEKRVARTRIKEETLFFDTDPVIRFHNQIDHYQFLINTIKNRTAQIKNTFRENFVKLAKENSDWTAFAEAIRAIIRSKKARIRYLEEGLDLKKEEFNRNPAETQRRLLQTYENLRHLEEEEHRQIDQRITLIEEQEKEIQRLHGLLTVEEKGKIVRKMRL